MNEKKPLPDVCDEHTGEEFSLFSVQTAQTFSTKIGFNFV